MGVVKVILSLACKQTVPDAHAALRLHHAASAAVSATDGGLHTCSMGSSYPLTV